MSEISPFDLQLRKVDVIKQLDKSLDEAKRIYDACSKEGVKLLLYGSVGIYSNVKENKIAVELLRLYRRNGIQDINFIVKPESRDKFKEVIYSLDYTPYIHLERTLGQIAGMFFKEEITVKVYYSDEMKFSHIIPINWNSEFTFDRQDLLLSKLQMHFPTNKDLSDIIALMLFDIPEDKVLDLTSRDWGLWKDVTSNLQKSRELVSKLITDEIRERDELMPVISKLVKLHGRIMNSPKQKSWEPMPEDAKYWRDF
ncbi:hypothetical protein [Stygiolobus caldivivus]|uniref:Uncharacterized protein n=1 Tax=Stygiolobus caldivivus TaxID=2824673 RepID=A0A8D5U4L7_9CREN|nr:hypothetical protein [Stygiolobus caldivivus]BCU68826.1 hypothetical protein KN1_01230 [Stygiolobus caldivivus]